MLAVRTTVKVGVAECGRLQVERMSMLLRNPEKAEAKVVEVEFPLDMLKVVPSGSRL